MQDKKVKLQKRKIKHEIIQHLCYHFTMDRIYAFSIVK